MATKFGYIGLGNIGKPMCATLVKAAVANGDSVMVYDVVPEPIAEMVALGAIAAKNEAEIAANCDLVGICVRHDADVEALLYGDDGMLNAARPDAVYAIHSTVTRDSAVKWAADAAAKGFHIIDAGITGGATGAADGQLCIMVGGDAAVVGKAGPMLELTSKQVVHCGDTGSGIVTKLANNLMSFIAFAAADEAVAVMKRSGLDPQKLFDVGRANGVLNPLADQFINGREALAAACTAEEMESIFGPPALLGEKDLHHVLELGDQLGVDLTLARQARAQIKRAFLPQN